MTVKSMMMALVIRSNHNHDYPNYDAPFEHRDRNRLTKIGEPKLNPTAAAEKEDE